MREAIGGNDGRVLLLGVTPELSVLGRELVATDNTPRMIERVWPGDNDRRRAILADWTRLPFEDGAFDSVIGDGSLNSAPEDVENILAEASRLLRSGGCAAFRTFCAPEQPESLGTIQSDPGSSGNVHALKWRIAMALAASLPRATVPVRAILEAFNAMFPDRAALGSATGWTVDEISTLDAYEGAGHSLGFPTAAMVGDWAPPYFEEVAVISSSGYPLAERCPILVCR